MLSQLLGRRSGAALLAAGLALLPARDALANDWIGDLVYCDANANGSFDSGDYPLNGVSVRVVCERNGSVCDDITTTSGAPDPSVGDPTVSAFNRFCTNSTWNLADPSSWDGRYLVNANIGCRGLGHPRRCTVTVDPTTVPADCNVLVTPQPGIPDDGNGDGDFCDAGDGPFPEGQPLGNAAIQGGCDAYPDPAPAAYQYTTILNRVDECSLHNDFGFTAPSDEEFPSRTPGYWKNHPNAVALFLPVEHCGTQISAICDAVALLGAGGGGLEAFSRHSAAAQLNCAAYGCPAEIAALIDAGNAACAAGAPYDFGGAAATLDVYNNLGDELGDDPVPGGADPKFCNAPKKKVRR